MQPDVKLPSTNLNMKNSKNTKTQMQNKKCTVH